MKQKKLLEQELNRFELGVAAPVGLQGSISTALVGLERTIEQYQAQVAQTGSGAEAGKHAQRVGELTECAASARRRFEGLRAASMQPVAFQSGAAAPEGAVSQRAAGARTTINSAGGLPLYEGLRREQNMLARGNARLDSILQMGQESLEDMVEQHRILQRVAERMQGSLRTLGVSDATIERIGRRVKKDKAIFWSSLTLLVVGVYYVLRIFG